MKRQWIANVMISLILFSLTGCATNPDGSREVKRTGIGALAGAAVGAGTGALFGGNRGANAAIGAGVGAVAGGLIGNYMDHQAAALKKSMPQAKVERQGEKVVVVLPSGILFDKNKAELKQAAVISLSQAAATLRQSQTNIIITGHSDPSGGDSVNMPLSQRRAERVRDFLVAQGVQPAKLTAVGLGSSKPTAPNDCEANRALNRRVELELSPDSTLRALSAAQ